MIDFIKDTSKEDAWRIIRGGKFTASVIYKLLSKGVGSEIFGKGALTYINEVACDAYTLFDDRDKFESYDMKMGKITESQAATHHAKIVGTDFTYYGDGNPYFRQYCNDSGGSPDSVLYTSSGDVSIGAEYKCPKKITHWNYLRNIKDQYNLKAESEQYYAQVQFLMVVFNCDLWHWCSYNEYFPNFKDKMLIIEVKLDRQYVDNLLIRLKAAIKKKHQLIGELMAAA